MSDSAPLPFALPGHDRAGHLRGQAEALRLRDGPTARLVVVGAGQTVLWDGSGLLLLPASRAPASAELIFLGLGADGGALFAWGAEHDAADRGGELADLRVVALALDPTAGALAAQAVAMVGWHRMQRHCGRCGNATVVEQAGHLRRCPSCGAQYFPRTDPAVIMLVVSGERCVLSQRPGAPEDRWSALAGFVEPGETPEGAVRREVLEEVGLLVGDVRYRGAQPWPFPSSLMLGFRAELAAGAAEVIAVDRSELVDARWFSRASLREAVAAKQIDLPTELSLGHRLIGEWIDLD